MAKPAREESYYDILRVSPHSSVSEITNAYYAAKNAFSKDSLATYSLVPEENTVEILTHLETAYLTLTNPDKRREYDKLLANSETFHKEDDMNPQETVSQPNIAPVYPIHSEPSAEAHSVENPSAPTTHVDLGLNLVQIRESKGLTLNDVSRITKIPVRYLKSLEEHNLHGLPAKVYIQGFLKNLAQLYRLDPKSTVSTYFEQMEKINGSVGH